MVEYVIDCLDRGAGGWVVTPNLDILRRWITEPQIATLCSQATLVVADGMALVWAARLQGTPLPERVAGSDLIHSLSEAAAMHGRTVYFMGGNPGTAETTARVLHERHPALRVVGSYCPPVGFEEDPQEVARIRNALTALQPDIVYVGLGMPKQERLIAELRQLLPRTWWLGVGVSFSFVSAQILRAPTWMQSMGLEWLHRMCQEPKRLAGRYLVHGLPFAARMFLHCGWRRLRQKLRQ